MNKEIKIKVIKLFIRFLKESSFYDELIMSSNWYIHNKNNKNCKKFDIEYVIKTVSNLNLIYFESYAKHILIALGFNTFSISDYKKSIKIELEWYKYCKTNLLKQNVNEIWELFKQTEDYKENKQVIEKYNENTINGSFWGQYIQKENRQMDCVPLHAAYVNDVMDIIANSRTNGLDLSKYQTLCNNLPSYILLDKWEKFYESNVELKY